MAGATNSRRALKVRGLRVEFPGRRGRRVHAVDGVDFDIAPGTTLGLVGESGCGKSTTGRAILRLVPVTGGQVWFGDTELTALNGRRMRAIRRQLQMIFQDPFSSLDARMRVGDAIAEPMVIHRNVDSAAVPARVARLLDSVGLPATAKDRFPHEFSGGQRQRIAIARALAADPEFLVCDEPISSLDVSVQAQVMNLFDDLQQQLGLTYLFIAHDLAAVRHISHRIAVMYLGRIVELTSREEVFDRPRHPYTRSLLSAVPRSDPVIERSRQRIILQGDIPSPSDPPSGCRFRTRCVFAQDICATEEPKLQAIPGSTTTVACHFWQEIDAAAKASADGAKR